MESNSQWWEVAASSTVTDKTGKPAKWYNNKSKLGLSVIVWPVLLYGLYKTSLIKRKTKQYVVIAFINLYACSAYIDYHHNNDVKVPFPETAPDYYGSMVATYNDKTTGQDLQEQVDDYKRWHGESQEHKDWASRESEWEAGQYTPLPILFLIYMIGSLGYTAVFFITKRKEL